MQPNDSVTHFGIRFETAWHTLCLTLRQNLIVPSTKLRNRVTKPVSSPSTSPGTQFTDFPVAPDLVLRVGFAGKRDFTSAQSETIRNLPSCRYLPASLSTR